MQGAGVHAIVKSICFCSALMWQLVSDQITLYMKMTVVLPGLTGNIHGDIGSPAQAHST